VEHSGSNVGLRTGSLMSFLVNYSRVFRSVVVVAFQIAFRAEIHANNVFLFFKNHF
jgi:hypothetical protein